MKRREALTALMATAAAGAMAAVPRVPARAGDAPSVSAACDAATGALGVVIERASGSVLIVDWAARAVKSRVEGLGDLSHASVVFSRDARFAYVFGRDGGLSKVDLVTGQLSARIIQAGNAIGGAISDDGRLLAVSNYEPGGVRVFDADTLAPVCEISADPGTGKRSKTVGLVDAPGRRFVYTLYDAGEIWIADFTNMSSGMPSVTRFADVGKLPYDASITSDGRHYIAGLFGEDGLVHLDLWQDAPKPRRILDGYGRGEAPLPVFKMPHLEGWAEVAGRFLLPAVGRHELLAVDAETFTECGRVATHGQPIFAVVQPGSPRVWVNFAHPLNDTVQVIDARTMAVVHAFKPGPAVLHLEFTPRGHETWISVRDADRIDIHDTRTFERIASIPAVKPSGIFFTARAHRIGQ
ncbi:MAG: protein nirF [Hyphomicrobiaceae bacterium]|nr:protein nirF [Hyphomicrobiaceae bacterium]